MRAEQSDPESISSLLREQVFGVFALWQTELFAPSQKNPKYAHSNVWLSVALMLGFGIRSFYLSQPMRYDESVTFLDFVNRDLQSLFYYPYPNNHVLHTLLVKFVTALLGASPITIRSIAFLAGIGCIPLVLILCRQLNQSGILAALATSIFPFLVFYSTNARGYTLIVLLTLILASVGLHAIRRPSIAGAILISCIASLGMFTMPSMLFPIAGLYIWFVLLLLIENWNLKTIFLGFIAPCVFFTVVFSLILYIPVILASDGFATIINNSYVKPQEWSVFLGQLYPHVRSTLGDFLRDIPGFLRITFTVLVLLGIFHYIRKRNYVSLLLLPALLFGSAIVLFLQHKIPFERTWIFAIPFIVLVADAGFTFLTEYLSPRTNLYMMSVISLAAFVFTITLISSNNIAMYPDTGIFTEAPIAAKFLESQLTKDRPNIVFESKTPATYPIYFYLWYYDIPVKFADSNSSHSDIIYIVKKSYYSLKDMTTQPVNRIFAIDDMEIFQGVYGQ